MVSRRPPKPPARTRLTKKLSWCLYSRRTIAASWVRSDWRRAETCACCALTPAIRVSSCDTSFSLSRICWPSAIRLSSDWLRECSSMRACASEAVRSPINSPCAWLLRSVWLAGEAEVAGGGVLTGDGVGAGVAGAVAVVCGPALGLGSVEGAGDAPDTVSASAPAGTNRRPTTPARLKATTATLRARFGGKATAGGQFTRLQKSLQLLRPGRLLPATSNPKKTASAGPFLPDSYSTTAQPAFSNGER